MAHWAEIDENNIVIRVLKTDNDALDEGYQFLVDNLGGRWIKTSYNMFAGVHAANKEPLRKNYASIGYIYDEKRDAFIPPKMPYMDDTWILNENTCLWEPSEVE